MSDGTLPDPPVPAEADLRGFPFMPLEIGRLFGSSFHALASDREWRAGVTLWLKAYHQVPAGSLPDDDIELCRLAELGRDLRAWRRIRAMALHGWRRHADGRLYHATVAEKVLLAWTRKESLRERSRKGNGKRWGVRAAIPDGSPPPPNREGERDGEGESLSLPPPAPPSRSAPIPTDWEPSASARAELSLSRPDLDAPTLDRRMVEFRAWCAETGKRTFNPDATWLGFMVKTHVRSDSRDSASRSGSGPSPSPSPTRRDAHARAAAASDGIDAAFARRSVLQRQ